MMKYESKYRYDFDTIQLQQIAQLISAFASTCIKSLIAGHKDAPRGSGDGTVKLMFHPPPYRCAFYTYYV